jgi:hypothetical protein
MLTTTILKLCDKKKSQTCPKIDGSLLNNVQKRDVL